MTVRADASQPLAAVHAGTVPYDVAWAWQRALVERRAAGEIGDVLLTLEHPPVYTAGRRSDPGHLLWSEADRAARGIDLYEVDRGGDITYHGPGQLVAYPIVMLARIRGVVDYVRTLERACVRTAAAFGIAAATLPGYTGVWVGDDKLAAIGVRVSSRGVTSHGLAFNVAPDLGHFAGIVPCGIPDRGVCSLASLGVVAAAGEVRDRLRAELADGLGATLAETDLEALDLAAPAPA